MRHRAILLGLCACATLLSCDSGNPVAPTGTVLSVNANPTQIGLSSGSAQITVTGFKPDGNPLNPGTQILVSTDIGDLYDASSGGNLVSTIAVTSDGRAVAYLRGDGRNGSATVTATLTTGGEATASAMVQIGATDTDRPSVVINANPTVVAVGGLSRISLLGRNSDNTAVSAGQRIRLTSTFGTLVADGGDANSPTIDSVITNSTGEAFATFVAGERATTMAGVEAILGTSEPASVTITINDAPATFSFQASPQTIFASQGDAVISLRVDVLNAQGTPVSGASAIFRATIGGEFTSGSGIRTTVQGTATDTYTVPQNLLTDLINAGGNSFEVSAEVIGEGAELPTQRIDITVNP